MDQDGEEKWQKARRREQKAKEKEKEKEAEEKEKGILESIAKKQRTLVTVRQGISAIKDRSVENGSVILRDVFPTPANSATPGASFINATDCEFTVAALTARFEARAPRKRTNKYVWKMVHPKRGSRHVVQMTDANLPPYSADCCNEMYFTAVYADEELDWSERVNVGLNQRKFMDD